MIWLNLVELSKLPQCSKILEQVIIVSEGFLEYYLCRYPAMSGHGRCGLIKKPQKRRRFQMVTTYLLTHSENYYSSGHPSLRVCGQCIHVYMYCRCWCPDRTLAQARKYIGDVMGTRYAEGVILDLEGMWSESSPRTPLICFLSMGSDPTNNIEALAKKLHLDCHAISMGQGQEVHARRLLHQSMTTVSSH